MLEQHSTIQIPVNQLVELASSYLAKFEKQATEQQKIYIRQALEQNQNFLAQYPKALADFRQPTWAELEQECSKEFGLLYAYSAAGRLLRVLQPKSDTYRTLAQDRMFNLSLNDYQELTSEVPVVIPINQWLLEAKEKVDSYVPWYIKIVIPVIILLTALFFTRWAI